MGFTVDPVIARCMRFEDTYGHEQLLCMLNGKTQCFTLYTPPDQCAVITRHKIRFINPTFCDRLDRVRLEDPLLCMTKLCKLICQEMANSDVALEIKEGSKRQIIVSESIRDRMKSCEIVIKNKKGEAKQYSDKEITTKTESFFRTLSESFKNHVLSIVTIDAKKILQERDDEERRKKLEIKPVSLFSSFTWLLSSFWSRTTSYIFGHSEESSRDQQRAHFKAEQDSREQRRETAKADRQAQDKRRDNERRDIVREQIKLDNLKSDIRRHERNCDEQKSSEKRLEKAASAA